MSAEEDTFDIDIYGEQEPGQQQGQQHQQEDEYELDFGEEPAYDGDHGHDGPDYDAADDHGATVPNSEESQPAPASDTKHESPQSQYQKPASETSPAQPLQQGTKRKASHDFADNERRDKSAPHERKSSVQAGSENEARSVDAGATSAIKLADLNWWTTEEDLRAFAAQAGVEKELRELAFNEHKVNGKSRGEAYMQFTSAQVATAVKREVEKVNQLASSAAPGKRTVLGVFFCPVSNPFKNQGASSGVGGGGSKYHAQQSNGGGAGRAGAYNQNYGGQRGSFGGGRGGFNQNRGGGFHNNNNNNNNGGGFNRMNNYNQQQQGGWMGNGGMNGGVGGFGNAGGFPSNPMMGMFAGGMGRGGMMNNMMGAGGFNMGVMGRGNMMGGMNMMGRGGWGGGGGGGGGGFQGGMQQNYANGGFQGGGGGGGTMQPGNKRARME